MSLDIRNEKGVSLDRQLFTWRELAGPPYSKLDDDAFTRVRVILMNGIEAEAMRFGHACARMNRELRIPLARVRRVEQLQQTFVNWLNPPDQSPIETTIGYEQTAIEVTAWVAQREPDPYLAQVYRFGMLEDFDHLYRFSGLLDRLTGKDANNLLQSYTDVRPGRPTREEHRAPEDDVREAYQREKASVLTKLHALTIMSAEHQVRDFYMTIGPELADPIARMLYAEIAAIEEQHVTQYESIVDPGETWLEKWLLHEANEVYTYWSCVGQETNPRIKAVWERFLDYELGHLHYVMDLMRQIEKRDPELLVPETLPDPIRFESQRKFIRDVLSKEAALSAAGTRIVPSAQETQQTLIYREHLNSEISPSELVTTDYRYVPGTEVERLSPPAIH